MCQSTAVRCSWTLVWCFPQAVQRRQIYCMYHSVCIPYPVSVHYLDASAALPRHHQASGMGFHPCTQPDASNWPNGNSGRGEPDQQNLLPLRRLHRETDFQDKDTWNPCKKGTTDRHLDYLKQYRKVTYTNLLTSGKLNAYLTDIDKQAQQRSHRLIEGMKQAQGNRRLKEVNAPQNEQES